MNKLQPEYAPLADACAQYGICRGVAYKLAREGLIDTFKIGWRRYVVLDSLRSLPQLLQQREAA